MLRCPSPQIGTGGAPAPSKPAAAAKRKHGAGSDSDDSSSGSSLSGIDIGTSSSDDDDGAAAAPVVRSHRSRPSKRGGRGKAGAASGGGGGAARGRAQDTSALLHASLEEFWAVIGQVQRSYQDKARGPARGPVLAEWLGSTVPRLQADVMDRLQGLVDGQVAELKATVTKRTRELATARGREQALVESAESVRRDSQSRALATPHAADTHRHVCPSHVFVVHSNARRSSVRSQRAH